MSQDFQMIGQASPELDAVADRHDGWQGATPEPPIDELTGPEFSKWQQRANRQVMGWSEPTGLQQPEMSMAGFDPSSAAAQDVAPFTYTDRQEGT